jgi:hypothetical protein
MIKQVQQLEDEYPQLCLLTLSTVTLAYSPLHMLEMRILGGLQVALDLADLERIINMCSFLIVRDNYVYFIHQSAKDYLNENASATIFTAGREQIHYNIFSWSLNALSVAIRYSCIFWVDHLCEASII